MDKAHKYPPRPTPLMGLQQPVFYAEHIRLGVHIRLGGPLVNGRAISHTTNPPCNPFGVGFIWY
jgi:hypothetical protein